MFFLHFVYIIYIYTYTCVCRCIVYRYEDLNCRCGRLYIYICGCLLCAYTHMYIYIYNTPVCYRYKCACLSVYLSSYHQISLEPRSSHHCHPSILGARDRSISGLKEDVGREKHMNIVSFYTHTYILYAHIFEISGDV